MILLLYVACILALCGFFAWLAMNTSKPRQAMHDRSVLATLPVQKKKTPYQQWLNEISEESNRLINEETAINERIADDNSASEDAHIHD